MSKTMMEEIMTTNWSDIWSEEDEDLVKELLDDGSPLLMLPTEEVTETNISASSNDQAFNRFISNIYSGPTISDIENALSVTNQKEQFSSAR